MELFNPDVLLQKLQCDALITSDPIKTYKLEVLKNTLFKKYVPPGQNVILDIEAKLDFLARNQSTRDCVLVSGRNINVIERAKCKLYDIFHSGEYQSNVLTLNACVNFGYTGPGSSRGTKFTDFVGKMFESTLTYTSEALLGHYKASLSERWMEAEFLRSSIYSSKQVLGNSLSTVPKDREKNRCICTEPSLNMYYQLGAKHVIEGLLKTFYHFDMSTQPKINKLLACSGSISGISATMDLKNASDSISLALVSELLPKDAYNVLKLLRSPYTECVIDGKKEVHELKVISTMGNGFTFPLMTLLFHVLLDSYLSEFGDRFTKYRDGIFGDDIILPSDHFDGFSELLEEIGFTVNILKSFSGGSFRESCGGDYYLGLDVRGVYIKEISSNESIYSAFNRLLLWSIKHDIPIPDTLGFLKSLVEFRPVPLDEAEISGFRVPYAYVRNRKSNRNNSRYYWASVPIKRSRRIDDSCTNHWGALIGFLGGYVHGNRVNLRSIAKTRYKVKRKLTPSWDWSPFPDISCRDFELALLPIFW